METTKRTEGKKTQPNTCPECGTLRDTPLHCDSCETEICEACRKGNEPFYFCAACSFSEDE